MTDLSVLAYDGVTSVLFSGINPGGADGQRALWRANAMGATSAAHPYFWMTGQWNGKRTGRRVNIGGDTPYTVIDSTTGLTIVKNHLPFSASFLIPTDVPDTHIYEHVSMMSEFFKQGLIRNSIIQGNAPGGA